MRSARIIALLSLSLATQAALARGADDVPNTVGELVESNGLATNGWLVVKTPSIVRMNRSTQLDTDERSAIDNYDALLKLKASDTVRADTMSHIAWLNLDLAQRHPTSASRELQTAITVYRRLSNELPADPGRDKTLYQLARAYQLAGEDDACIGALTELTQRYPHSSLAADAAFRAGEMLYAQGRYPAAAAQYEIALTEGGATFSALAQYKLAWSDYKQRRYALALPLALTLLDRYLPPGTLADPKAALAAVSGPHAEITADSLRLVDLSFIALGGADPIGTYFVGERYVPRFDALLYASVADRLLSRQRYGDAAALDAAFVAAHADHPLAPLFLKRQIAALDRGGFTQQEADAKAQYIAHFEPGAPYWHGHTPDPAVLADVHEQLGQLARYRQARAQAMPTVAGAEREAAFAAAATAYQKLLDDFPNDPNRQDVELSFADTLLQGGHAADAAQRYDRVAYQYPAGPVASGAAFAEVQTYRALADNATGTARQAALLHSVDASVKLAAHFPTHPQRDAVLVRAAQDLHGIGDDARALAIATPLTDPHTGALDPALRRQALTVVADAHFARHEYAAAQSAYAALLATADSAPAGHSVLAEQLAQSIYRQGEAARDAGDLRTAAAAFANVSAATPDATLVAQADYDAAHAFVALKDWPAAERMLEQFRQRFASNPLIPDADKMLADAYYADGRYGQAAAPYERIAARTSETAAVRVDAAWFAASSADKAGDGARAATAYASYLSMGDPDTRRAIAVRERLAQLAETAHDTASQRRWLQSIVDADTAAGAQRDAGTRLAAARAALTLGRLDAAAAQQVALTMPLDASLARRRKTMQTALQAFDRAAGYDFAETTTAALLETGIAYHAFAQAIEAIAPPRGASAADLENWHAALAKEAQPFDAKARAALEVNLSHAGAGVWNESIRISAQLLAQMDPALYGKSDERDANDPNLR